MFCFCEMDDVSSSNLSAVVMPSLLISPTPAATFASAAGASSSGNVSCTKTFRAPVPISSAIFSKALRFLVSLPPSVSGTATRTSLSYRVYNSQAAVDCL